jgi:hypothetical protein
MYLFEDWNCVCGSEPTKAGTISLAFYGKNGTRYWACGSEPTQASTISLAFYGKNGTYSVLGLWFRSRQGRFQLCEHEQHIRYAAPDLQTDINLSQTK